MVIASPYATVNGTTTDIYKANVHTHTPNSDGNQAPAGVIDAYKAKGDHVLALTSHNYVSWSQTSHGRDPAALNRVAVQGNELSSGHLIVSLFSGYASRSADENTLQTGVGQAGGIAFFARPGRYTQSAQ